MRLRNVVFILCVALILNFMACTKENVEIEPTTTIAPTEGVENSSNSKPTPTPQQNYAHDYSHEHVTCEVNPEGEPDVKTIWKVDFPTETPDPSWTVESVDGDTVTYSMIECKHTPAPEGTAAPEN